MTEDLRAVPLDADQFAFLEDLGFRFQRAGEHNTATRLLAICLAWRVSPKVEGADLSTAAHPAAARPRHLFACDDIDESAGQRDLTKPGRPDDASSAPGNPPTVGEPTARLREIPPSPVAATPDSAAAGHPLFCGMPALDPWSRRV